jgi:cytochrome c peroxidase
MKTRVMLGVVCWATILFQMQLGAASADGDTPLTPKEQLGKNLFFDRNLSTPPGQSCAVCHGPEVGFTWPDMAINVAGAVYEGAVHGRFGNRKPPSSAYAGDSPVLSRKAGSSKKGWIGGMFWDGRATGEKMGDPLAEQAQGPYLNPLEQNNPSARVVVEKVASSKYAPLFEQVWGKGSLDPKNVDATYERIARSIAAYERSHEVEPFSSKSEYRPAQESQESVLRHAEGVQSERERLGRPRPRWIS